MVRKEKIDGESMLVFQANTITYAVPVDSNLGRQISKARLGIVIHTEYKGATMVGLSPSFNPNLSSLKRTPSVWFDDAELKDVSGSASFTDQETNKIENNLIEATMVGESSIYTEMLTKKTINNNNTVTFSEQKGPMSVTIPITWLNKTFSRFSKHDQSKGYQIREQTNFVYGINQMLSLSECESWLY